MNLVTRSSHAFVAAALIALAAPALAQQKAAPSLKAALTGTTWAVVSADGTDTKGQKRGICLLYTSDAADE